MKTFARALSALLICGLTLEAQGIGRWMGDNLLNNNPPAQNAVLPAAIRNSVVRVESSYIIPGSGRANDLFASGVVIAARRDRPDSMTGMLCILTADHDSAFPNGVNEGIFNRRSILFTDRVRGERGIPQGRRLFVRGPVDGNFRVDIALMGIPITDWANQVPAELTPAEIAEPINDADLVISGFGRTARIDTANREMNVLNGARDPLPGTYRAGVNRIDATEQHTTDPFARLNNQRYRFNSLRSDMDFQGAPGAETSADAHFLNADSGGPTFQRIRDVWRLVGSHSISEQTRDDRIIEGADQWDVRLWDNREWIAENCRTLMVPEPSSVAVLALLSLVALRRSRKL